MSHQVQKQEKLSHVLDFCVNYYFKSPIPQAVGIQLRDVTNKSSHITSIRDILQVIQNNRPSFDKVYALYL